MDLLSIIKVEDCTSKLDEMISLLTKTCRPIVANPNSSHSFSHLEIEIGNPKSDIFTKINTYPDFESLIYPSMKIQNLSGASLNLIKNNQQNHVDIIQNISPYTVITPKLEELIHTPIDYSNYETTEHSQFHQEKFTDKDLEDEIKKYDFQLQVHDIILVFDQVTNRLASILNYRSIADSLFDCIFFHNEGNMY